MQFYFLISYAAFAVDGPRNCTFFGHGVVAKLKRRCGQQPEREESRFSRSKHSSTSLMRRSMRENCHVHGIGAEGFGECSKVFSVCTIERPGY
jgi:hypothetical protein